MVHTLSPDGNSMTVEMIDMHGKVIYTTSVNKKTRVAVTEKMMMVEPEKNTVRVDLFFYAFVFCKENKFNAEKVSVFLSILLDLFMEDIDNDMKSVDNSFAFFQTRILRHAVERSPHSIYVFSRDDVLGLINFITDTYYRNFRLYRSIFTKKEYMVLQQQLPFNLECVPVVRPLREGILLMTEEELRRENDIVKTKAGEEDDDDEDSTDDDE